MVLEHERKEEQMYMGRFKVHDCIGIVGRVRDTEEMELQLAVGDPNAPQDPGAEPGELVDDGMMRRNRDRFKRFRNSDQASERQTMDESAATTPTQRFIAAGRARRRNTR
jgi:hypothetical protein